MGGHASRRDKKQEALDKLNLARRVTATALAKRKSPVKAQKSRSK